MKLDTAIVITKGALYVMASSLAQWSNTDWPSRMQWLIILIGAGVGGATQLLSYLSGSYSDYVKGRSSGPPTDTTTVMLSKIMAKDKPN